MAQQELDGLPSSGQVYLVVHEDPDELVESVRSQLSCDCIALKPRFEALALVCQLGDEGRSLGKTTKIPTSLIPVCLIGHPRIFAPKASRWRWMVDKAGSSSLISRPEAAKKRRSEH